MNNFFLNFSIIKSIKRLLSGALFFHFLSFVLVIILAMHSIEESLSQFDIFTFISYEVIFIEIGTCYVICYFATMFTIKSQQIAEIAYDISWYKLSTKHRKIIVAIVHQGQTPYTLDGLGIFTCSLETFGAVRRIFNLIWLSS